MRPTGKVKPALAERVFGPVDFLVAVFLAPLPDMVIQDKETGFRIEQRRLRCEDRDHLPTKSKQKDFLQLQIKTQ
jgi:hypothetical protein